jgi:hypothetical protein
MARAWRPSPCCGRRSELLELIFEPGIQESLQITVPMLMRCALCGKEWTWSPPSARPAYLRLIDGGKAQRS